MQNECSCSRTLSAHCKQPQLGVQAIHSPLVVFGSVDSPSRRSDDSSLGLSLFSDERYCPIATGPIHQTSTIVRNVCSTNNNAIRQRYQRCISLQFSQIERPATDICRRASLNPQDKPVSSQRTPVPTATILSINSTVLNRNRSSRRDACSPQRQR